MFTVGYASALALPSAKGKKRILSRDHCDTIEVIDHVRLKVPTGGFSNVFVLVNKPDRSVFVGNVKRMDTIWFQPGSAS